MNADRLTILPGATEPIYRQIGTQLRRLIASGQLPAGEELPSVSRAYCQLEAEGLLTRLRGKGMVVAAGAHAILSPEQRLSRLQPQLAEIARQARELDIPARLLVQRQKSLLEDSE